MSIAIEKLDLALIAPHLAFPISIEIYELIDSTNRYLLDLSRTNRHLSRAVCLAEQQTEGRGRLGRQWISPLSGNIYLSILWRFSDISHIAGLSLAIGVGVVQVLQMLGIKNVGLKWPNDIFFEQKKLGGILIESSIEPDNGCSCVVGLGLNYAISDNDAQQINQPWTDLTQITPNLISRNEMVAKLLVRLVSLLSDYHEKKLAFYLEKWHEYDCFYNQHVTLTANQQPIKGIAKGVNTHGELLVETKTELLKFNSGEVTFSPPG